MIDRTGIDLINRAIDGILSADDAKLLNKYLAANPEARAYHEDLQRLASEFRNLETIDPPPDVKRRILQAISQRSARPQRGGALAWLTDMWQNPFPYRRFVPFSAGAVCGALVMFAIIGVAFRQISVDPAGTVGTILGVPPARPTQLVDKTVHVGPSTVNVVISRFDRTVLVELTDASESAKTIELQFDSTDLRLIGCQMDHTGEEHLVATPGRLAIDHARRNRYLVRLGESGATESIVTLTVRAADSSVSERFRLGSE